jgi:4-hydroxy-3-methylbut-2-enyl diphosphate reductase
MSDETTGATTTAEAEPVSVPPVETSAPVEVAQTNGLASAPAAESAAPVTELTAPVAEASVPEPELTMEDYLEQMPPLDEIEVPGADSEPRRGGGRGRGRRNNDDDADSLRAGQLVTGTVVHIDSEGVLVDVGMKSEGLIRPNELSREPVQNMEDVVKVGDKVDVIVLDPEGKDGNVLLSKKRADFERAWDKVQEALVDGRILSAMVDDRVRGGLVVNLGIRGFVPASHVGNGKIKNIEKYVGQSIPLKVLEVDRANRKVVLSHKLATEEEREREKKETLGALGEGQVRTGTVRRVADYGAFVDLGGIDGLLHVSEMSWTRVKHPSDVLKVGDQIQVMILRLSLDQGRISLGMRQILPDPWQEAAAKYQVGDTVEGEVTRLVPFGAFVLLEGGIEGIIPNSELAHRRIAKPADVVDQGQQVQVKVIDVRPDERRMTLSLRALQPREADTGYRDRPERTGPPAPGGATPPPPAADDASGGRREKRGDRRGGGGRREDDDFRQYMGRGDSGGGGGMTIGDMFPELMSASRGTGKKEKRRRPVEEDDDDLSNLDFDVEETTEEPATTETAEQE